MIGGRLGRGQRATCWKFPIRGGFWRGRVTGGMCRDDTPTRTAIELSSPVAFADRLQIGELNSWHSFPLVRDEGLHDGLRHRGRRRKRVPANAREHRRSG